MGQRRRTYGTRAGDARARWPNFNGTQKKKKICLKKKIILITIFIIILQVNRNETKTEKKLKHIWT